MIHDAYPDPFAEGRPTKRLYSFRMFSFLYAPSRVRLSVLTAFRVSAGPTRVVISIQNASFTILLGIWESSLFIRVWSVTAVHAKLTACLLLALFVTSASIVLAYDDGESGPTPQTPASADVQELVGETGLEESLPRGGYVSSSSLGEFDISTGDGLIMTLSDDGFMTGVSIDGENVGSSDYHAVTIYDPNLGQTGYLGGSVQQVGNTLQQIGTTLGCWVNVTYVPQSNRIEVLIEVDNGGAANRCIDLSLQIPLTNTLGAHWWDGPNRKRSIESSGVYRYADERTYLGQPLVPFGKHKVSYLPYASISYNSILKGISGAVNLDWPAVACWEYYASPQRLLCTYYLGLSEGQAASPGDASMGLFLYKTDYKWGMRSAAARYYSFFPEWFTSERANGGAEAIRGPLEVPSEGMLTYRHANLNGLRFRYGGGLLGTTQLMEAFRNSAYGVASLPYINPVGIRLFCTQAQYETEDYEAVLEMYSGSYSTQDDINQTAVVMIRNTLAVNRTHQASVVFKYSGGRYTAEFSLNPSLVAPFLTEPPLTVNSSDVVVADLLDWYSKWILMPSFEDHFKYGAEPEGLFFDNVGFGFEDIDSTHIARTTTPLSYVYDTSQSMHIPCAVGAHAETELLRAFRVGILAQYYRDMTIYGNVGVAWPYGMWQAPYLDAGLQEQELYSWGYGTDSMYSWEMALLSRMNMYQKPISGMDYNDDSRENTEQSILRYLHYGIYPLMTEEFERDGDLYAKYVPIADALSTAGWGPLTYASAEETDNHYVTVERFGHWYADSLYFTVRNWNDTAIDDVRVKVEAGTLAMPTAGVTIRNVINGTNLAYSVSDTLINFHIDLKPGETKVFRLFGPDSEVTGLAYDVPNPLLPTTVELTALVESNSPPGSDAPYVTFMDGESELGTAVCSVLNSSCLYARLIVTMTEGSHTVSAHITGSEAVEPYCLAEMQLDSGPQIDISLPIEWPYWVTISFNTSGVDRSRSYARVEMSLSDIMDELGVSGSPDTRTFRIVDSANSTRISQWLPDLSDSGLGVLVFPFAAEDAAAPSDSEFTLYFDLAGSGKPRPVDLGLSFKSVNRFGVQLADDTMVLISPLGANSYATHCTPVTLSEGFELASKAKRAEDVEPGAGEVSWKGTLRHYENFSLKVLDIGPNVIRILCLNNNDSVYAAWGAILNVYASGDVEVWAFTEYAQDISDRFEFWARWGWGEYMHRTACYMGPNGKIKLISYPNGEDYISNFTEPWFGQRLDDGRYSFTMCLSPTPVTAGLNTWYNLDRIRYAERPYLADETCVYRLVHVAGVGSMQDAVAHVRSWLNTTYVLEAGMKTTVSEQDPGLVLLVAGAGGGAILLVTSVYLYTKRKGVAG